MLSQRTTWNLRTWGIQNVPMISINCIGVGHWGPNLVRIFSTHPETRVGTVCDLSEERLALVRRNVPTVANFSTDPFATATDPEADAVVTEIVIEAVAVL